MNSVATWPSQAEAWLDERGKGAWLAAMILGFILFWPIGLALLFYMIWSNRMQNPFACSGRARQPRRRPAGSSGNAAFDAYRQETLRRLEEEQEAFRAFLDRLRAARDKSEFDQFLDERAKAAAEAEGAGDKG